MKPQTAFQPDKPKPPCTPEPMGALAFGQKNCVPFYPGQRDAQQRAAWRDRLLRSLPG